MWQFWTLHAIIFENSVIVWFWIPNKVRIMDFHFVTCVCSVEIKTITQTYLYRLGILWPTGFWCYNLKIWYAYDGLKCVLNKMFHINISFLFNSNFIINVYMLLASHNQIQVLVGYVVTINIPLGGNTD